MAHCAANDGALRVDLRRALDANVNGTRMHNRIIVYVRVCITYAHVAPHCRCVWCGRQDAEIMRRICGCGWCYGA